MSLRGVIFDFNGTLFWDTVYHNRAWDVFLERRDTKIPDVEKMTLMHGKTNRDIFENLFGRRVDDEELERLTEEKESLYRDICRGEKSGLAPGAQEFLDFLSIHAVPRTIATASRPANVDFFFDFFSLSRWFDRALVVCDDGKIRGKPHPDIYLEAARKLGIDPGDAVVFEDSSVGIEAARAARAGKIIIVAPQSGDDGAPGFPVITDFRQVDRGLF